MKKIFRLLKPWIKSIIISQMKNNQDMIVTAILKKISTDAIPLSGEQEEQIITVLYDALESVVITEIDKI